MSMNLHIVIDGNEIAVYQTPSYITYMCMVDSDGYRRTKLHGKKAKRAAHCYLEYVTNMLNGVYSDDDEYEMARRAAVAEHIHEISRLITNANKIEVFMQ